MNTDTFINEIKVGCNHSFCQTCSTSFALHKTVATRLVSTAQITMQHP